jgi:hypothetical protein
VDTCAPHREFLAAMADGETALVPLATVEHIGTCVDCQREIRAHEMLSSRLRQASDQLEGGAPKRRHIGLAPTRLRLIAASVALAILGGAAGFSWFVLSHPDPVQAAMNASSQPVQIQSSDPAQVAQWCRQASGRNLPAIELDGMQVVGARMDRVASTDIVTVAYTSQSGERITVSWLEGQVPTGSGVEETQRSGHELLIVHSHVGTAVISGSSSGVMWQAAAAVESAA